MSGKMNRLDYIEQMAAQRDREFGVKLLVLIAIAMAVRMVSVVEYANLPDWTHLTVDNWYHHNWAQSIADGNVIGDTTYFRAPFYIWCLGLLYAVLGSSLWVARGFGLIVGLLTTIQTYRVGRQLGGDGTGLAAGGLYALYPLAIYFETELLLDPLFTLLLTTSFLHWIRWISGHNRCDALLFGATLGLAIITRPTGLVLLPMVVIGGVLAEGRSLNALRSLAPVIAIAALPLLLTFGRNLAVAGDPVLVASQGGVNLYVGNNPESDGVAAWLPEPMGHNWRIQQTNLIAERELGGELKPGEVSSYWFGQAGDWIANNPGQFAGLYLKKLYYWFDGEEYSNNRSLTRSVWSRLSLRYLPVSFAIILGLAACGALLGWRKHAAVRWLVLAALAYALMASLFFCNSRFRLPMIPLYAALAGLGMTIVIREIADRPIRLIVPLVIGIGVFFASYLPVVSPPANRGNTDATSQGLHAFRMGDFEQARLFFESAHRSDSTFPETNLNLGAVHLRLGNADTARHYFAQEVSLHPKRWRGFTNMASLALLSEQYDVAFFHGSRAVRMAPFDVTAAKVLVRAASSVDYIDSDSLYNLCQSVAEGTGNDLSLLNMSATILDTRDDTHNATRLLEYALLASPFPIENDDGAFEQVFPNSRENRRIELAQVWYQLGFFAGKSGDLERSVECSRKALERDPELQAAYVNLSTALRALGRQAEADSVAAAATARFSPSR